LYLAKEYLHLKVEERDVYIDNLSEFKEVGACGTAAVITPIGGIKYGNNFYIFGDGNDVGIITKRLYDTLTKIQFGELKAPDGWIYDIK
jgi:branched-chain amino acid aminotransferase